MRLSKMQDSRKRIIPPPFTPTSVRMRTGPASLPPVNRVKAARRRVSVVTVQSAQSVMDGAVRRVDVSAMTSGRRAVPVRTSPNV